MKFRVILAIFLLSLSLGCKPRIKTSPVKSPIEAQHASTHRIKLVSVLNFIDELGEDAHCSATAVAPTALLTAAHCVTNTNTLYLDTEKVPTTIVATLPDGADHLIYIVNRTFTDYVPVSERPLVTGEWVHFWGNPGSMRDVFHNGYFDRMDYEPDLEYNFQRFVMGVWGGDSGSGIMDETGRVVAVISLSNPKQPEELSLPLAFTEAQLKVAGVNYYIQARVPSTFEQFLDLYFGKK